MCACAQIAFINLYSAKILKIIRFRWCVISSWRQWRRAAVREKIWTHDKLLCSNQWWKQDQNVKTKTKTKIVIGLPRPIKQQQDYITETTLLLQHACLLSKKNNFVQKNVNKWWVYDDYCIWHCFCTYCTKKIRPLLHFSIIMSHSARRAQQCWKQDQKYKTKTKTAASLRPVLFLS